MTRESNLSAWRVRNANTTGRRVLLESGSGGWTLEFTAPAHSDVYVVSGVGRTSHRLTAYASGSSTVTGVESKTANNSPFNDCR